MAESGEVIGETPAQTAQYYELTLPEETSADAGCSPLYCVGVAMFCVFLLILAF